MSSRNRDALIMGMKKNYRYCHNDHRGRDDTQVKCTFNSFKYRDRDKAYSGCDGMRVWCLEKRIRPIKA